MIRRAGFGSGLAVICLAVGVPAIGPANGSDQRSSWASISDAATSSVKTDWPGLTAGVAVDRSNGDVFMVLSGQGIWKSTDQGATFKRVDGGAVGGRCETGYGLCADPAGR